MFIEIAGQFNNSILGIVIHDRVVGLNINVCGPRIYDVS